MRIKQEITEIALKEYRAMISRFGKIQTAPFVEAVNTILGICSGDLGLSTRKTLWTLMRKTKFICSEIGSVENFTYDPSKAIRKFLQEHPTCTKLVLACGHFLPSSICEDTLYTKREASCGMCDKAPHLGEMTMSLEARDTPDITADVKDPRFWNAIPDGRFDTISDDSLGWISVVEKLTDRPITDAYRRKPPNIDTSKTVLDEVYRALKSKGEFIISVASEDSAKAAVERMKEYTKFKYLKTNRVSDVILDVVFEKQ